jgi:DNA uptake protein ComE-like DNA-binding protein
MKLTIPMLTLAFVVFTSAAETQAQTGTTQNPVLNPNTATEAQLQKAPHMTPEIVKAILAGRPYKSIVDLNKVLVAQKLTPEQRRAFYGEVFVPINLNTATDDEILLIPGMGKRMLHEFKEYRPWKTMAQFHKEIGKYVDDKEVARLARYVVIG